jgi:mannosyltransferase OCH1-like enzyme
MPKINYMWYFKKGEVNEPPQKIINHNRNFIQEYSILSPKHIEPLCIKYSPELSNIWEKIPHWVIKADLGRLLYIYFNSDFYFDADCIIQKDFMNLFNSNPNKNVILFIETIVNSVDCLGPLECKNPDNVIRIANYAFGTKTKKHPFIKEVIDECIRRINILLGKYSPYNTLTHRDILWVCGPDVITTIYHKNKSLYPEIILLDTSYVKNMQFGSWR